MQIKAPEGDIYNKHSLLNSSFVTQPVKKAGLSFCSTQVSVAHAGVLHYTANVSISAHPLLLWRDSMKKGSRNSAVNQNVPRQHNQCP